MYMYAGLIKRFLAFWIDKVIITIIALLITYLLKIPQEQALVYSGINPYRLYNDFVQLSSLYVSLFVIILPWFYYAVFEMSSKQATPGKMLLRIVVVNLNGDKVTFWQASLRYFGKFVSWLILGIGFIMIAFTDKRQALHDILAQTLVKEKFAN